MYSVLTSHTLVHVDQSVLPKALYKRCAVVFGVVDHIFDQRNLATTSTGVHKIDLFMPQKSAVHSLVDGVYSFHGVFYQAPLLDG